MKAIKATRLLERNMQKWLVKATHTLIAIDWFQPSTHRITVYNIVLCKK
jgi:hypothetical protein